MLLVLLCYSKVPKELKLEVVILFTDMTDKMVFKNTEIKIICIGSR